ncbi:MAG: tripartite tricarboxylate transporter TctB family protein [Synergistaceae bacterium]|nr:tripartite tricarboxylate transporter TctB family protein [Synergistaceae bacterium]MBQ6738367.1 tripartite tricarboxylate transporter TctB family protein [Synergistaceae bacterium]MBR0074915.1 tripartite tricarboxylate transporter TctB family protein [Synergistaceae bacterium]MBR0081063.1 tripartite tricarboxylate transporter TctB family protein [Synergistaceae bacterium]MBR0232893.1 tripartite tricarboxylate transporter TctB family protein [Synergistaceae bacterium]
MKKTDIGVCLVMYAVCALFLYMTLQLKKAAQIYPLCIIALLAGLTTLHVINMVVAAKREGVTSGLEDFKDFLPGQFFTLLAMIVIYIAVMPYVGFYIASILFMTASLLFLRVKIWQIVLSEIAIFALVYCAFTLFLEVKLPAGSLLG